MTVQPTQIELMQRGISLFADMLDNQCDSARADEQILKVMRLFIRNMRSFVNEFARAVRANNHDNGGSLQELSHQLSGAFLKQLERKNHYLQTKITRRDCLIQSLRQQIAFYRSGDYRNFIAQSVIPQTPLEQSQQL